MPLAGLVHQPVKVQKRAVLRVDVLVVGDVVAEVYLGRGIARRQPDGVNADVFQVIEPLGDAIEVTDAVAVRVLKAARIDLVDDGVLPPVLHTGLWRGLGGRDLPCKSQCQGDCAACNYFLPMHYGLLGWFPQSATQQRCDPSKTITPARGVESVLSEDCAALFSE